MQIVCEVPLQSPDIVWLRHEAHYWFVWECAEARTVLGAVVTVKYQQISDNESKTEFDTETN
jgi:hypothetical protein